MKRSGTFMRGLGGLGCHLDARYRVPDHEAFLKHRTVLFCAKAMTTGTKVLSDATMGRQEGFGVASPFEAPPWSFPLTGRVVGVFRSSYQTFVLTVLHATQPLLFGRT